MIKAFAFDITSQHQRMIGKMTLQFSEESVRIFDLFSHPPQVDKDDIVLAFGPGAHRALREAKCRVKLELPPLSELTNLLGNEEKRCLVHHQLAGLKKALEESPSRNIITEEDLPPMSMGEVRSLVNQLQKEGHTNWSLIMTDGSTIKVSMEPNKEASMTFTELFILKLCMDMFKVKEIRIDRISNKNTSNNSS